VVVVWWNLRNYEAARQSFDLSYFATMGSFRSSVDNLTRRVHMCGFWSLGQSEYKISRSITKTIFCKGGWNSRSKSRGKSKGIWTENVHFIVLNWSRRILEPYRYKLFRYFHSVGLSNPFSF
jgi:hypothetical protein